MVGALVTHGETGSPHSPNWVNSYSEAGVEEGEDRPGVTTISSSVLYRSGKMCDLTSCTLDAAVT